MGGDGSAGVLAEVVRNGVVESVHRGSLVALDAAGDVVLALGDPSLPVLPRSSAKPLQAVGMLRSGLPLRGPDDAPLLAVAAASHSGEPEHVALARRLLDRAGLDETLLRCPPDWPLDTEASRAAVRDGSGPARVLMNCSGKHAAMLLTCVHAGWPVEGYLDPSHPLQVALREAVEDLAGEPVTAVAVDGCGAPLFGLSLHGLARAFARLVTADAGTPERAVADAMRAHPRAVGGTGRDVTALMEAVPGLLAKDGAEGVYAAALPGGAAVALKVDDGAGRARGPALVAALRRLGASVPEVLATVPVLGGGAPVGEVRAGGRLGGPAVE